MKKIIDSIGSAIDKAGEAFDKNFTSKEEVLDVMKEVNKQLVEAERQIVLEEARGNKLQRSWRPVMMLIFTYIIFHTLIIAPMLLHFFGIPKPDMPMDEIWNILQISISGYVIGRTGEKVLPGMTNVAKGIISKRKARRHARGNQ